MEHHPIEFPFDVPAGYRRLFMLYTPTSRHFVAIEGRKIYQGGAGDAGELTGKVLDWMQESIESVKMELGH